MSPDSEVIWIFVAFLVIIEIVSDTKVEIYNHFLIANENCSIVFTYRNCRCPCKERYVGTEIKVINPLAQATCFSFLITHFLIYL